MENKLRSIQGSNEELKKVVMSRDIVEPQFKDWKIEKNNLKLRLGE